jgi:putative ABC transport system substrate-binding protein
LRNTEIAARSLGLKIRAIEARAPAELDAAFKAVADARPSAFFTLPGGMFQERDNMRRVFEFATKSRLPGVFPNRVYAQAGGLISYGPNLAANSRRAAAFVDKILKGAQRADLPVEQPTTFELVVNLKTAKTLGLKIHRRCWRGRMRSSSRWIGACGCGARSVSSLRRSPPRPSRRPRSLE